MEQTIDITGIDKAKLLQELYLGTRALGMGHLHDKPSGLSDNEAKEIVEHKVKNQGGDGKIWFDYVAGRPIKIAWDENTLYYPQIYDRDAGEGACQEAVNRARG